MQDKEFYEELESEWREVPEHTPRAAAIIYEGIGRVNHYCYIKGEIEENLKIPKVVVWAAM